MQVYISKYALTQGIIETEAEVGSLMIKTKTHGYLHDREWHKTREEAVKRAEEMRVKKITSLKKKITQLEKMRF